MLLLVDECAGDAADARGPPLFLLPRRRRWLHSSFISAISFRARRNRVLRCAAGARSLASRCGPAPDAVRGRSGVTHLYTCTPSRASPRKPRADEG